MGGHMLNVFHNLPGTDENIAVDALENILPVCSGNPDQEGVIDMAVAKGDSGTLSFRQGKSIQDFRIGHGYRDILSMVK